ncbi:hypothetical protein ACQKWADRAFT_81766 [Trichoderma austrokoningii]
MAEVQRYSAMLQARCAITWPLLNVFSPVTSPTIPPSTSQLGFRTTSIHAHGSRGIVLRPITLQQHAAASFTPENGVWASTVATDYQHPQRWIATRARSHHVFGPWPDLSEGALRPASHALLRQLIPPAMRNLDAPGPARSRSLGVLSLQPYLCCGCSGRGKRACGMEDCCYLARRLPPLAALAPVRLHPGPNSIFTVYLRVQVDQRDL